MGDMEKNVTSSDNDDVNTSEPQLRGVKLLLVVVSLISATFLWGLDGTIVADIQATFVEEFNAVDKLAWNSVAFFLGAAATVLSWGQVYGHFNAKWVFVLCVIIFETGSAICGAAPSESALIAGRAICGVGGAGMYTGVLTLLSLSTSEKQRALYMGIPGITWGVGTVLGPVIGGAFALDVTWRWGFYINFNCVFPADLFYTSLVSARAIHAGEDPVADDVSQSFQYVRGDSPLKAGIYLLPFIFAMVATVMVCGTMVSKTGRWMPWFFYGGTLVLIGGALMYTVDEHTSGAKIYGYSILIGSGSGAYIQMPFNAAQGFVEPNMIPAAVGLITGAQLAAPAVTLSIANSIFLNKAVEQLRLILPSDAPILQVVSGVGSSYLAGLDQAKKDEVVHIILRSMSNAYVLVITSGALTLLMSIFLVLLSYRPTRAGQSMASP
ncbi:MAG: hypothetical protein Q9160_007706 [Pyrenula sp. 1 TL-2023]